MAGKKSRTGKTSQGLRRSSKPVKLTGLEKVLLGGGALVRVTTAAKKSDEDRKANTPKVQKHYRPNRPKAA